MPVLVCFLEKILKREKTMVATVCVMCVCWGERNRESIMGDVYSTPLNGRWPELLS